MSRSVLFALGLVFIAVVTRFIPHANNFAPIGAISLFCATYLRRPWSFLVPVIALFLSDLVLNNIIYKAYYPVFTWFSSGWLYLSYLLVAGVGVLLLRDKVTPFRVLGGALLGAVVFFLVSNFSTFMEGVLYPKSVAGLMACYTAGLPFLKNTVQSNVIFAILLFGSYEWVQANLIHRLRTTKL